MPMDGNGGSKHLCFFLLFFSFAASVWAANVTYDHRSLIIDGQRKLIFSASIHYPRSVPSMWPGLVSAAKEGGVDAIETYVFWNGHEITPGNYYFEGRYDLVKFVKIVQQAGLYLILRIGPFVAAEWNFGGIPVWLHFVPGTILRTDNEPFKSHMQNFTTLIVNLMKQEKCFASQGGPIILAQIENEYGDVEAAYGESGKRYAMWAARMAVSQNIGIPWIMCKQYDAPNDVINTCNSFYCDQFKPNSDQKPMMWTENWPGWFKTFGATDPHRPTEDIAFAVARFFQEGGCLQNYYMYHGGTNFDRTAGGPFITTSYDYDAPIDEYGLLRYPKWPHLRDLHKALKLCEHALLHNEPNVITLGPLQKAHVYKDSSGACAAIISNVDEENEKKITFQNAAYILPPWSVSILPDCKNVAFNTAKVRHQTNIVEMVSEKLSASKMPVEKGLENLQWDVFKEQIGVWRDPDFSMNGLVDHLNTTKDTTDYLWYTTSLHVDESESFLTSGRELVLMVESKGHAVYAFVNKEPAASASGNGSDITFKFRSPITLKAGKNEIAFLSMTVGLQNAGPHYDLIGAGLTSVKVDGFNKGTVDLSLNTWFYKMGLEGEYLNIYRPDGLNNVKWLSTSNPPTDQPLTWFKTIVDAPHGKEPVGLDMEKMGKGQVWLNGKPVRRYWPRTSSIHDECTSKCNYKGKFMPSKCRTGCGEPTQRWYHVPRSWFQPSRNVLVVFEERGGDPNMISFSRRLVTGICGFVSENHPFGDLDSWDKNSKFNGEARVTLPLKCPEDKQISSIKFASFGNPDGSSCGSYVKGDCHDPNSMHVVEKICLGENECILALSNKNFNMNLCPGFEKKLAVEAACS